MDFSGSDYIPFKTSLPSADGYKYIQMSIPLEGKSYSYGDSLLFIHNKENNWNYQANLSGYTKYQILDSNSIIGEIMWYLSDDTKIEGDDPLFVLGNLTTPGQPFTFFLSYTGMDPGAYYSDVLDGYTHYFGQGLPWSLTPSAPYFRYISSIITCENMGESGMFLNGTLHVTMKVYPKFT
jgi:hypothetical protein